MTHPRHFVLAGVIVTGVAAGQAQSNSDMNDLAERYVKLVLAMGQHDSDYVDAYYGPQEWRADAEARPRTLDQIGADAETLIAALDRHGTDANQEELDRLRHQYLRRQLDALRARVRMLDGRVRAFDDESSALDDRQHLGQRRNVAAGEDVLPHPDLVLGDPWLVGTANGVQQSDAVIGE